MGYAPTNDCWWCPPEPTPSIPQPPSVVQVLKLQMPYNPPTGDDPLHSEWPLYYLDPNPFACWTCHVAKQNQYNWLIYTTVQKSYLGDGTYSVIELAKLVKRQIARESQFRPEYVNPQSGAKGLMQMTNLTVADLQRKLGGFDNLNVFNAKENTEAGVSWLMWLRARVAEQAASPEHPKWRSNDGKNLWLLTFADYNAGYPTMEAIRQRVEEKNGDPSTWSGIEAAGVAPEETKKYINDIFAPWDVNPAQ